MRVAVTGSHGLIGSALVRALKERGDDVTRLVRSTPSSPDEARWDPDGGSIDAAGLEGHDAVAHLAGEGIGDSRWSEDHKRRVMESRRKGTTLLASTIAGLSSPPAVLVSASAIGWYGHRGEEVLTEASGPGEGFLAEVCRSWETSTAPAADAGIRVVRIRTGLVMSQRGGAMGRMLLPFRLGLGGPLGGGRQWWSWIAVDDEVGAVLHLLDPASSVSGPVNVVAPAPVRQRDFARVLGEVLRRPAFLPTPLLPLRAAFGSEMVTDMLLASQRVAPEVLVSSGYTFRHAELEPALRAMLDKPAS